MCNVLNFRWANEDDKRLKISSIVKILAELSNSGDWKKAFDAGIPQSYITRNIYEAATTEPRSILKKLFVRHEQNIRESRRRNQFKMSDC